jgi:hypothetical protein
MTQIAPDRPARRPYRTLLVSAALAALALGATMIVDGDWQSALAAVAGFTGGAFLLSLTRLLANGERPARPAPAAAKTSREFASGSWPRPLTLPTSFHRSGRKKSRMSAINRSGASIAAK